MKLLITSLWVTLPMLLFGQLTITNTNHYSTIDQMLLANEINESGEPFAEALGYNLDDLDPMVPNSPDSIAYTLGIENYEYSRYQLGTVISRSGIGLHIIWSPIIMQNAAMEDSSFDGSFTGGTANGFKEDDEMMKTIMGFGMRANQTPPANAWPQFGEFMGGDPKLPQAVAMNFETDFQTLRWDRSKMDKIFNPGAMGQTLMKQYLWAQDMLGAFHDGAEDEVDPNVATPDSANGLFDPANNVFYGGDNLDGFIGMVLTAEATNKMMLFRTKLAYDGTSLGGIDPATYDPANGIQYFPHMIGLSERSVNAMLPPQMDSLWIVDPSSHLFDQLSLLWGTLNFKNMMDPNNSSDDAHIAYHSVFDGDPFPADASTTGMPGPFDLMKGMSKVVFLNLMSMHFNATEGTFVGQSGLSAGSVQMGTEISAVDAGYILPILAQFVQEFSGTPLEMMATNALTAQANFILTNLKDGGNGYFNSYTIGTGADTGSKLAVSQAAIARGLYAAFSATGDSSFLEGADNAYNSLITDFYVPSRFAFKTEAGNNLATYTPFAVAVITGGLREAALVGGHAEAPQIFTRFFTNVGDKMQLCEASPTGEMGNDSDGDGIPFIPEQQDSLPPVFATEATLNLSTTSIDNDLFAQSLNLRNYPNPVADQTTIAFDLPIQAEIRIEVYDLNGRHVETLIKERRPAGPNTLKWDTSGYPSGLFYYQLSTGDRFSTNKVILLK